MKFTPNLTKTEWKNGLIAMTVAMFLLPGLIAYIPGLSGARLNFAAHFISAGTAVYCLRRFLGSGVGLDQQVILRLGNNRCQEPSAVRGITIYC